MLGYGGNAEAIFCFTIFLVLSVIKNVNIMQPASKPMHDFRSLIVGRFEKYNYLVLLRSKTTLLNTMRLDL